MDKRASGVLMHVSSLPGAYGIGCFGKEAKRFIDFLSDTGCTYWQVLPFTPTDAYNSPYASISAFAGNRNFIDLEQLRDEGLLTDDELREQMYANPYSAAFDFLELRRIPVLYRAFTCTDEAYRDKVRAFAEEKRSKTDQLLYSLPIRLSDVVVGKYLAMLTVSLLPVAVVSAYPLLLSGYGHVDMRSAYASILMFFLLGACLTSIGMFISSVTENQVTSAVVTLVIMLITYFMTSLASYVSTASSSSLIALSALALVLAAIVYLFTKNLSVAFLTAAALVGALLIAYAIDASAFSGLFPELMKKLSLFERFYGTIGGMFDLTAIVYYLSIIGVFLFFTTETLEKRRWS